MSTARRVLWKAESEMGCLLGTGLGIDTCGWEGREAQGSGEREIAKQTQWRLPQGMRALEWSLESRSEVGGVG